MNIKKDTKIGSVLFAFILISLLPVVITTLVSPTFSSGSLYSVSVGVIFLIQSIVILSYYCKWKKLTFNKRLFIFAWLFMISQTITLLISSFNGLKIDNFDFINIFVRFISFSLFVNVPYQFSLSKKGLEKFMFFIVTLGCIACLYNMIINFSGLKNILNINNPYAVSFKSFFIGRNSFAQLLFFSMIANTFLFFTKRSVYNWICYPLFILNIIATLSRTATASVGLFILIFCLIYFRKRLLTRHTIIIFASIIIFVIASNTVLSDFIVKMLIRSYTGTTGRSVLWSVAIQILNQNNWFFGIGYFTSISLLKSMGYSSQFHNFYLETLVGGGLIDLLLHLFVFRLVINNFKKIYKNDRTTGIVFFSSFIALLFYSLFESVSFFSMGYVDSIFRIFFITIPILYSNNFILFKRYEI